MKARGPQSHGLTWSDDRKRNEYRDERDERMRLPLDPETALRALLAVDPEDEPADLAKAETDAEPADDQADQGKKAVVGVTGSRPPGRRNPTAPKPPLPWAGLVKSHIR